jgi:adenine/guanine/hypoxanthine permease
VTVAGEDHAEGGRDLEAAQAQEERRPAPRGGNAIAEYFKFAERGTDLATEVKAGVTTFMVMAYILFLNPNILSNMYIPDAAAMEASKAPLAAGTALVAGVMSIAMGLIANVPIALAAGLGINALGSAPPGQWASSSSRGSSSSSSS